MTEAILLDTNVLVYLKDQSSEYHASSLHFLESLTIEVFVSSKNLTEYLSATTRGEQALSSLSDALEDIEEFMSVFSVLYPSAQTHQQLTTLLRQYEVRGKRIHDYEIAAIALANGISKIATFNAKDFRGISGLEVIVP